MCLLHEASIIRPRCCENSLYLDDAFINTTYPQRMTYLSYFVCFQPDVKEYDLLLWHVSLYRSDIIEHFFEMITTRSSHENEIIHLVRRESVERISWRHECTPLFICGIKRDALLRILHRKFLRRQISGRQECTSHITNGLGRDSFLQMMQR